MAGDDGKISSEDSAFIAATIAGVFQVAFDSTEGFSANFNLGDTFSISLTDAGVWSIKQNDNMWEVDGASFSSVGRNLVKKAIGSLELSFSGVGSEKPSVSGSLTISNSWLSVETGATRSYTTGDFEFGRSMFDGILENIDRRTELIDCAGVQLNECIRPGVY